MTVSKWLANSAAYLENYGIERARLDIIILLEDCLKKDRAWILAHPELKLKPAQVAILKKLLKRRSTHEPLAYIRGHCEFYGRKFLVNKYVLQPRPETETMVDVIKELVNSDTFKLKRGKKLQIGDIGSGSGAIGITLALEIPESQVQLIDIDRKAVSVAKRNVDLYTLNINVIVSDLLHKASGDFDALVANLPYLPDEFHINLSASHEPKLAIYGGKDGLDIYRRLFYNVDILKHRPLLILTEALPTQHTTLKAIASKHNYKEIKRSDFIQAFKLG